MTLMFNIPSGLYFGLFQIPGDNHNSVNIWVTVHCCHHAGPLCAGIGTRWMNYTLLTACLTALPPILMVKETYRRSDIDG